MGRRAIKQIYIPYYDWECYNNGMWFKVSKEKEEIMLEKAIEFTSNHKKYGEQMLIVVEKWENTMINHLTNININRKAFLGHCAVCYKYNIPEYITRKAWAYLTDEQQKKANLQALKTIKKWEQQYMEKLKNTLNYGKKDVIEKEYQTKLL